MTLRPETSITTSHHRRIGAVVVRSMLALAAFAATPASAAAPPPTSATFALSAVSASGTLHLRATPGHTLRGSVRVRNLSRRRIAVRLQPADVRNAVNGNADYVTTRLSASGRWVRLAATTVRLAPGTSRDVGLFVRVPAGTRGAVHYAGVVALDAADLATAARAKSATTNGITISRINRQALPITVRLPGPLTRRLTLRSVKLDVQPGGAGLVLGLLPRGNVLIQSAPITLRISRGTRTILRHSSTLGQLFPDDGFEFRIPWEGSPTAGDYRVRGVIRPRAAAPVYIDQTLRFTPAKAEELTRETPPVAAPPAPPGIPVWVWAALGAAAALLIALSFAVWRLTRRSRRNGERAVA